MTRRMGEDTRYGDALRRTFEHRSRYERFRQLLQYACKTPRSTRRFHLPEPFGSSTVPAFAGVILQSIRRTGFPSATTPASFLLQLLCLLLTSPSALASPCGSVTRPRRDASRTSRGNPTDFPCANVKSMPPRHAMEIGLRLVLQTRPGSGSPNLLLVHRPACSLWLSSARPLPDEPCHSLAPSPPSGWGRDLITMYWSLFILSHSLVHGPDSAHNKALLTTAASRRVRA